jgi:hypothetical protein
VYVYSQNMSIKYGYNMTSNKLVMTKVHDFFNDPRKKTQKAHNTSFKAQYYSTFVRLSLDYTFAVWSPAKKESISQINVVQHWAARFAWWLPTNQQWYGDDDKLLNWTPLEVRRNNARLVMICRIVYNFKFGWHTTCYIPTAVITIQYSWPLH